MPSRLCNPYGAAIATNPFVTDLIMLDFDYYVRRHGEAWVLDLVERLERYEGVRSPFGQPLEQRWAFLMQTAPKNQTLPRAA